MFIAETVVTEWTSLSVSCVDESLSGPSVLLLMPLLSFGPKSKRKKRIWLCLASYKSNIQYTRAVCLADSFIIESSRLPAYNLPK